MFSVVFGIVHPKLCEELPEFKHEFFDIGESEVSTIIFKNLMKDLLDYNKHKSLSIVFDDFFKSRAIQKDDNEHFNKILNAVIEFQKWYSGNKSSGIKMYLVKREGNKVIDINQRWNVYRETPGFIPKKRKKKLSL